MAEYDRKLVNTLGKHVGQVAQDELVARFDASLEKAVDTHLKERSAGGRGCLVENENGKLVCHFRAAIGWAGNMGEEHRCRTHGGGAWCTEKKCTKPALPRYPDSPGEKDKCREHGGGSLCKEVSKDGKMCKNLGIFSGVTGESGIAGKLGYCAKHGGGLRCITSGCPRGALSPGCDDGDGRAGERGCCIKHLGGRRCIILGCPRGAQSPGRDDGRGRPGERGCCAKHGGGRRCVTCSRVFHIGGKCTTNWKSGGKWTKIVDEHLEIHGSTKTARLVLTQMKLDGYAAGAHGCTESTIRYYCDYKIKCSKKNGKAVAGTTGVKVPLTLHPSLVTHLLRHDLHITMSFMIHIHPLHHFQSLSTFSLLIR